MMLVSLSQMFVVIVVACGMGILSPVGVVGLSASMPVMINERSLLNIEKAGLIM
jgi:hypothetical protein